MNTAMKVRTPSRRFPRRRQAGVVLLIAMIMLVAMSLAGVALVRSVDTAVVVAGNVAFKEAAVQSSDRGVQEAVRWLAANSAGPTLQSSNASLGYFSSRPLPDPDWFSDGSWTQAVTLNGGTPDAGGNVVSYLIHRMCTQPDTPYNGANAGVANECGLYFPVSGAAAGGSMSVGSPQFAGTPQLYYRVTTRVQGPRNTITVTQSSVLVGI